MKNKIAASFAEAVIKDALTMEHLVYGIRTVFMDESPLPEIGDILPCSRDWQEGCNGEEELDGTCAVQFRICDLMISLLDESEIAGIKDQIAKRIIAAENKMYVGDTILLVAGDAYEPDTDALINPQCKNSVIIKNCILLAAAPL